MSTLIDFTRQFTALARKNALLKTRFLGTLFLEIAVPTFVIICIGLLSKVIPKLNYDEVIPDSYLPIASFANTTNNLYTSPSLCNSYGNLVWNCNDKIECSNGNKVNITSIKNSCQAKKIAVAPVDYYNSGQNESAAEFVKFANQYFDHYHLSPFTYFQSESSFLSYIGQSSYAIDPDVAIYSGAVIFNAGAPSWDFSLRLNRTYSSVRRNLLNSDVNQLI